MEDVEKRKKTVTEWAFAVRTLHRASSEQSDRLWAISYAVKQYNFINSNNFHCFITDEANNVNLYVLLFEVRRCKYRQSTLSISNFAFTP